jgi:hypothetical protein
LNHGISINVGVPDSKMAHLLNAEDLSNSDDSVVDLDYSTDDQENVIITHRDDSDCNRASDRTDT